MRTPLSAALLLVAVAGATPTAARADGILNPSGIVLGGTAVFSVSVQPASFPDAAIHWSADPAFRVSFPDGTNGRTVTVRGEALSNVVLRVGIKGYAGEGPVFYARVVPSRNNLPGDWGSDGEEGYYPSGIMHSNIVVRLLMYGEGDGGWAGGLDIPFGDIDGLWYEVIANPQTGSPEKVWRLSRPRGFL